MSKRKNIPHSNVQSIKRPTVAPGTLIDIPNLKPAWRVGKLDFGGKWNWNNIDGDKLKNEILIRLSDFETMKWCEIENRYNHSVKINELISEAQKRLIILKYTDDIEELFSLRISKRERVWGIRDGQILNILWWDPNHEICPSKGANN